MMESALVNWFADRKTMKCGRGAIERVNFDASWGFDEITFA